MSAVEEIKQQVVIVGAGPVGLLGSWILTNLGVPVLLIERFPSRQPVPKAHALSPRSLEICRQLGISTAEIRTYGAPREEAMRVRFRTVLSGEELGTLPYERMDSGVFEFTPEMIHNISQPEFQDLLVRYLESKSEMFEIRRRLSFHGVIQEGENVLLDLKDEVTGEMKKLKTRFLIGCDGAGSAVRSAAGITMSGEPDSHRLMTIHIDANLKEVVGGDGCGMLNWILDPKGRGNFIGYNLAKNCVFMHHFDADKKPISAFTDEECRRIVDEAIGKKIPYNVLNKASWAHTRRVADTYCVRNVFLAGDSAHTFPPTGGLGLNSGIGDIHALAWRLAAVLNGWGGEALLASYSNERRPVAEICSHQSIKNGKKIFVLLKEFLSDSEDLDSAREKMHENLKDAEVRKRITDAIEFQREHFDNLNLHIGYKYIDNWQPTSSSDYVPSFEAGSRLPHAWIDLNRSSATFEHTLAPPPPTDLTYAQDPALLTDKRNSTLDLVHVSGLTLLVGPTCPAVDGLAASFKKASIPLRVAVVGQDFEVGSEWLKSSGLADGGALLVRPDQHVLRKVKAGENVDEVVNAAKTFVGQV
ncbi:3-propionate hydroxylase [Meredithblackwellia eburnea MCA 4105]